MRENIFSYLSDQQPQLLNSAQGTAQAAQSAASNPGFGAAADMATATARGDYLRGSPYLDEQFAKVRGAANAEAANEAARIRSQYTQNGLPWSTTNQQAQQSAMTSRQAGMNAAEAQARLQNYGQERQNQMAAVDVLSKATGIPLQYLQSADMAQLAPLSQIAQLIAGLAGGGQIEKPDVLQKQSIGRQFMSALGEVV